MTRYRAGIDIGHGLSGLTDLRTVRTTVWSTVDGRMVWSADMDDGTDTVGGIAPDHGCA